MLEIDPDKNKPFDKERERLLTFVNQLKEGKNAPTYIVDSGGGYQAFWVFENPMPATSDSIRLYEGASRGLAEKYNTDKVQNIDRIMRIPYTLNIPTAKKKGRKKAWSKVFYATSKEGVRYAG